MFRTQSLKLSRNKQPLPNLNALLQQYQTQVTKHPKSARFHTKTENRPKTMSMERVVIYDMNAPTFKPFKMDQAGENVHSRTLSQFVRSGPINSCDKVIKTSQQLRKQKMIHMFSMQNMRKQLINSRKMSAIQYRTRQMQKKQKKQIKQKKSDNKRVGHDLRIQMFNNLSNKQLDCMGQNKKSEQNESNLLDQYKKEEQKRSRQAVSYEQRQSIKKQYLKKGTSINKSILNSLIKLKLSRNHSDAVKTSRDGQKCIGNDQIYKMIKVYKGLDPVISERERLRNKFSSQNKQTDQNQNYIQGWYHQTEDFDIQPNHMSPNTQSAQI